MWRGGVARSGDRPERACFCNARLVYFCPEGAAMGSGVWLLARGNEKKRVGNREIASGESARGGMESGREEEGGDGEKDRAAV